MEGQKRPSVMGFSSMYFRSSKRFDRASLIDGFKQIKDRGVRYEDLFPGSYDPAARVKEIIEDETDAEVIFNGVGTVWNGIKLCPDKELEPGLLQGLQRLDRGVPGLRARAVRLQRHACRPPASRTASTSCSDAPSMGLRTVQLESYPSGSFIEPTPEDDRFWAAAVEIGHADQRAHPVLLPRRRPRFEDHRRGGAPDSDERAKKLGIDIEAGSFPVILAKMITSGVFERFPDLRFVGTEVHTGWVPYYLERFDESVRRNRRRVEPAPAAERVLPPQRDRSSTSSTRSARPTATTSAWATSCGAPTSRTRRAAGPSTTSWAARSSSVPVPPRARSSGSCGGTRRTLYKMPYDEPATVAAAA